jgi:hypothetical protein
MTPEERIRMLLMGPDWGVGESTSASQYPELEGRDPFATTPPEVRLPPMYAAGQVYMGLRPSPVPGLTHPEEMDDAVSFEPPSVRERTAAALQKRRQMRGM